MGLFGLFGKKPKKKTAKSQPKIAVTMTVRTPDGRMIDADSAEYRKMQEEADRERHKRERLQTEAQKSNKRFLSESGVDVDGFLPEQVIADALMVIDRVCPSMSRFDHGLRGEEPRIVFSPPTKTGKVPKNVVEAYVSHEVVREVPSGFPGITTPKYGDRLSVSISYLASGAINKVDLTGSHEGVLVSVSVRSAGGRMRITGGQVNYLEDDFIQALYLGGAPDDPDEASDVLAAAVDRVYALKHRK